MRTNYIIGYAFLLGIVFTSCQPETSSKSGEAVISSKSSNLSYARHFAIDHRSGSDVLYVFGNRHNRDTTAVFVLSDSLVTGNDIKGAIHIQRPCKKIAALSSIYSAMFCELNSSSALAAIDNIDYVNNEQVLALFEAGKLLELARTPEIDLEKTIALAPDIIFTFGMGNWEKDLDEKLRRTGIPVAVSIDHLEETPLARAEWIKFFALFVNKSALADSIFALVETRYLDLKRQAQEMTDRPTVFSEIKYSDAWYLPGGKSYVATLFNDAGANYLWKDDRQSGSLPLSFEQVYARAKNADYWLNLSTVKTKNELLSYEPRYTEFKAFKTGKLFNNTKHTNRFGYSDYWETGMIHPERVLSDLIGIFHPEKRVDFFYYEQIQ